MRGAASARSVANAAWRGYGRCSSAATATSTTRRRVARRTSTSASSGSTACAGWRGTSWSGTPRPGRPRLNGADGWRGHTERTTPSPTAARRVSTTRDYAAAFFLAACSHLHDPSRPEQIRILMLGRVSRGIPHAGKPAQGSAIENTSDGLSEKISRARVLARGGHPDSRKECGLHLRDAGERFCKEVLVNGARESGARTASLTDYDRKTLEWLLPRVSPLLHKDASHPDCECSKTRSIKRVTMTLRPARPLWCMRAE